MNQKCRMEEILVNINHLLRNGTIGQNFKLVVLAFFAKTVEFQSLTDCSTLNDNKPSPTSPLLSAEVKCEL